MRRPDSRSAMDLCDDTSSVTSRSRDSYDPRVSPDQDVDFQMEETGLRRLHLEDQSLRHDAFLPSAMTGQKRRASSPPGDEGPSLHTVSSASDLFRRRESGSRTSPGPRFHSASGSISSTASGPRSNSYTSTALSVGGSSMTSVNSYGRISPAGLSPAPTDGSDSPYVTSISLNPSPRGSISRTNHARTLSESRPIMTSRKMSDTVGQVKHSGGPKMQGVFICECCPKKPKRFDSAEELKYYPLFPVTCYSLISFTVHTSKKSSMNVRTVAIVSRIKTRRSVIRILYTCAAIRGHVLLCLGIQLLFTYLQRARTKLIPVGIVEKTFPALASPPHLRTAIKLQ